MHASSASWAPSALWLPLRRGRPRRCGSLGVVAPSALWLHRRCGSLGVVGSLGAKGNFCLAFCSVFVAVICTLIINTLLSQGPIVFLKLVE